MSPFVFSLFLASIFAVLASQILGSEGWMNHPWVDIVFWTIIVVGAATSAVNAKWDCLPCRIGRFFRNKRLIKRTCQDVTCT